MKYPLFQFEAKHVASLVAPF